MLAESCDAERDCTYHTCVVFCPHMTRCYREAGKAVFLQTQRRTVIKKKKNELHIYFLFLHLNYLCNLL